MTNLTWSTMTPTEAGWYWWRREAGSPLHIGYIYYPAGSQELRARWMEVGSSIIEFIGGEWAGPLVPPEEG